MMNFHEPFQPERALELMADVLRHGAAGDGEYTVLCTRWMESQLPCRKALMTTSCTHALELALYQLRLEQGDEVIVPSFTYPSTANAVLLAGGQPVYCEVEPRHLTLDINRLEAHITERTRAVIPVHYGGICCDMEQLGAVARAKGLVVIEDAAQAFLSTWQGQQAGTLGDLGCFSFHGTKDFIAGEGGALLLNSQNFEDGVAAFRMKGTDCQAFRDGLVSRYQWVSPGSSYSPSELNMALLWSQLALQEEVLSRRRALFAAYAAFFSTHCFPGLSGWSMPREGCRHNGHLYYIIFTETSESQLFQHWMQERGIPVRTHFVPLHESAMGARFIRPGNRFVHEEGLGNRLVRLPLHPGLSPADHQLIMDAATCFFRRHR